MVLTVPIKPLYLRVSPGAAAPYSWRRTLAVSIGMVTTSATQAEKEAIPTFLMKKAASDSPAFFVDCILVQEV